MAEDAIISFTIRINAELSEQAKSTLSNLQDAKNKQNEPISDQEIQEEQPITVEQKLQKKMDDQIKEKNAPKDKNGNALINDDVVRTLNKLDSKGLQTLSSFASNPSATALNALTQVISLAGPEGQALIAIIALAVSAPTVIKKIVDVLSVKGGPLNRDYLTNLVTKQVEVGVTRVQQKRIEQGEDQLTFSQKPGFTQNNAAWSYNSYIKMNETRIARIGLTDRGAGVVTS